MSYILHNYRRCPFCIRVRIVLCLKKIDYEIVEEPLREWTPWMKEWSEQHTEKPRVPILRVIADDGTEKIIPESNDINLYLDESYGMSEFTPQKNTEAHYEMLRWFVWCDTQLKPAVDLYKYGANLKFDARTNIGHTKKLQEYIQYLEDSLASKKYLLEERLTLSDIAIIPFIRQIMRTRGGEFSFEPYPNVLEWTSSIIETDWFKNEVMKSKV